MMRGNNGQQQGNNGQQQGNDPNGRREHDAVIEPQDSPRTSSQPRDTIIRP
jgi:hypothetical protein